MLKSSEKINLEAEYIRQIYLSVYASSFSWWHDA